MTAMKFRVNGFCSKLIIFQQKFIRGSHNLFKSKRLYSRSDFFQKIHDEFNQLGIDRVRIVNSGFFKFR